MRDILLALIVIVFVSSLCFAEEPSTKANEIKTFTGKVVSVTKTYPKPPYWRFAILTIINENGEMVNISVVRETSIIDVSGNDMCKGGDKRAAWQLNGKHIGGAYSAKKDYNEAISINCLE